MAGSVVSQAQAPAETSSPAASSEKQRRGFWFRRGVGLNFVKPDKTADFEAVVARVREALQKSVKSERQQQAAGWKVFRAQEPGANGSVLYVFTMDPAVKGADYAVSAILAEAFPAEAQALYRTYAEAYASGQLREPDAHLSARSALRRGRRLSGLPAASVRYLSSIGPAGLTSLMMKTFSPGLIRPSSRRAISSIAAGSSRRRRASSRIRAFSAR